MIDNFGLDFAVLEPEACDMRLDLVSGGGVIFGVTGGVTEAVLRRLTNDHSKEAMHEIAESGVRGEEGIKEFSVDYQGTENQDLCSQWSCQCEKSYGSGKERRKRISSDRNHGLSSWLYHGRRTADQSR